MKGEPVPTGAASAPPADAFRFGRNWERFVSEYLDSDRERLAAESLRDLVGDVEGKRFLDIGCGSGLFSLCAYRAQAKQVISIDVDPDAISATTRLHSRAGSPSNWSILHRSILEPALVEEIGLADVVYSWGVLHHTGDMYTAIRNASSLVEPGGLFAIAIYNKVSNRWLNSERWWHIKRAYNLGPRPQQLAMEWTFNLYWALGRVRKGQNPHRVAREYRLSRGMALRTDQVDWLGGFPYEFATPKEIVDCCERECGLRTLQVLSVASKDTGNNQFVFQRPMP